ncbi:MAG: bifunctional UDP-N-acetylglucosamine diphosphorylase/glucosamine-1-phosphate N-acetyltransferase GlmU [Candidatus Obscuribacterales bacterium]|nr:bifunctional UDP-N-acetylglucosamine diphosphorylase/glucosamine-1-phosphate N-acetyltransferase GlmU [Candidatus Obscuribacterales bacterium]
MSTFPRPVRAVVLAAGQGKRMKSALPKVLHPVLGKEILARVLDAIDALNPEHIHIVTGHGSDQVNAYLQRNPPRAPWSTHLQQPQLGTGHALAQVAPSLNDFNGTLLVAPADSPLLSGKTLSALAGLHFADNCAATLLSAVVDNPRNYGRVIRDKTGQVCAIVEDKDATPEQREIREINAAIYCLEWPALKPGLSDLKNDNKQGEYYLTDLIAWSTERKMKVGGSVANDPDEVEGINSRLELSEAWRRMREHTLTKLALESGVTIVDPASTWIAPEVRIGKDTTILPGCYIMGDVEIGEDCVIGPSTQINGPARVGSGTRVMQSLISGSTVGANARIGPFAHIRDGADISDQCRIGNFVEIKKSTIAQKTNVSHLSYIGDASLGSGVNIGAGTITANYDKLSGKKSRTVIGDDSSTGSNSVLVAPVVIGQNAMVAAGTVVTRDVPDDALAVGRARQDNKASWVSTRTKRVGSEVGKA